MSYFVGIDVIVFKLAFKRSEILMRSGTTFVKQMGIIGSFADETCAEQLFMDFFTESLKNDEKFRDGRSYILNTTCSVMNLVCMPICVCFSDAHCYFAHSHRLIGCDLF